MIGHGRLLAEGTIAEVMGNAAASPEYRLTAGDAPEAARLLNASGYVEGVSNPATGELGEEIRVQVGPEGIGPVVRELVEAGVEVRALVPVRPSLEDLFLELTEGRA